MGIRLRDMISLIRACKTAAEERAVIAKECALLRDAFKEDHQDYRHRNVAKLMFIHMLGFPTHFGQMECIKLIAAVSFPEKRIGYLGLMLLLDERQEVLLLVTNSLKNDINNSNQFITGLALCALGNICTAEMARDLASDVEHLLQSNNAYIRKKAALCAVRIVRKVPDLIESFIDPAIRLLGDKHHGVLISGVKLCIELCQASDVALEQFRKQVSTVVRLLRNLVISGYAPEYDVNGISDPFLQIELLKLLRYIGKADADSSDVMSDILAQVATNTEGNKNAGHAILYECVQTIMAIEAIGGLRVLAINILGRFLAFPDNNIRYVALNTLVKVVSIDTQAVQRHRATIVECVKDSDISIRRRALDLVYNLVNENNVKVLTKELVEYLKVSDPEFKLDLTAKIAALVQKFSPSQRWYFDQMILLMVQAGQFVAEGVTRFLVIVISNASELQGYVVRTLYRSFQDWRGQESLAQVTVWCIGEYGELLVNHSNELQGEDPQTITESDAVDVIETILKDVRVTPITQAFALTALLKLSSRFPQCTERIKALLSGYKRSHILELQQRSNEFESIITRHSSIRASLLERMPPLDVDSSSSAMEADAGVYTNRTNLQQPSEALSPKNMNSSAQAEEFTVNLLDVLSFQPIENPVSPPVSAGDALLNLLGSSLTSPSNVTMFPAEMNLLTDIHSPRVPYVATPTAQTSVSGQPSNLYFEPNITTDASILPSHQESLIDFDPGVLPPHRVSPLDKTPNDQDLGNPPMPVQPELAGVFPTIVALQTDGLKVTFDFAKPPGSPETTIIKASYTNLSSRLYTDFVFQAAVPKFMKLQLNPASSNILPPDGSSPVTQMISVNNSLYGQKPLIMRLRITYKAAGRNVLEQVQVNDFPAGL